MKKLCMLFVCRLLVASRANMGEKASQKAARGGVDCSCFRAWNGLGVPWGGLGVILAPRSNQSPRSAFDPLRPPLLGANLEAKIDPKSLRWASKK